MNQPPLSPQLDHYAEGFRKNRLRADQLCDPLAPAQLVWHPSSGGWSVADCLMHLNVTATLHLERIDTAIERALAAGSLGSGPFRSGWLSRWMLRAVQPNNGRRFKAPRQFRPPADATPDVAAIRRTFRETGDRWQHCLRRADGLDLARVKVASPVTRLLRLDLGGMLAVQVAHERRHLEQAGRVTQEPGFPDDSQ